jgi:protein-S-isoprenylcysteine O-methyltransferase Ste14
MNEESLLRLAVTVIFLAAMPIGGWHRMRAHRAGGSVSRRDEGWFTFIALRTGGALTWLAVFAQLLAPERMVWATLPLPGWLRWAGVAIVCLLLPLMAWTLTSLGTNLTDTVAVRERHTLVQHGPYRWVRHPFYLSALVGYVGVSLALGSWLLAVAAGVTLALLFKRTDREEANLIVRFGGEYLAYMARTGRFFPRCCSNSKH